ncbi:hypothetical protein UA08_03584 [Talaromyces atroroseus]|uniref:NADP-dependent oxidoreductase domain-containing protein n=1 Tax=Talaromyces atroroseus TaxID=1441469 RepID=A0A225AIE5_TALAT|nr:hypothetical protein UA08_03584 [Talaromyces atroroseus]OKL61211.1 hypothetical protein UA08_03584 [Talaromyces atroroseus]
MTVQTEDKKRPDPDAFLRHSVHDLLSLKGRTVVITGGARGLGLAFGFAVAESGGHVAIIDYLETPHEHYYKLEKEFGVKATFDQIVLDFGRIDGLITAAGICPDEPFLERDPESVARCFNVNTLGTYYAAQLAAIQMDRQEPNERTGGKGSIVLIASVAAYVASKGQTTSDYCSSKGAVVALAKALGVELAGKKIRVNSISPGYMVTDMTLDLCNRMPWLAEVMNNEPPMRRMGDRTDLKVPVVYLLSDATTEIIHSFSKGILYTYLSEASFHSYTLKVPSLGLGTWQSKPGEVRAAVRYALENGHRHIDAAYCYGNEEEVGLGIRDVLQIGKSSPQRHLCYDKSLPVAMNPNGMSLETTGRVWLILGIIKGNQEKFPTRADGSRDLLLERSHVSTSNDMEKLLDTGKVEAIGVANYSVRYLNELLSQKSVIPAVNQNENHVLLPQQEIVDLCKEHGIRVTAYSPSGSNGSPLLTLPVIQGIAERKDISPSTVLLSWLVNSGRSVLAKSVTPTRIAAKQNLVALNETDLKEIDIFIKSLSTAQSFTRYVYPAFGVDFEFPDKA